MSAPGPSRLARTAATTVGWLAYLALRLVVLFPVRAIRWILSPVVWAARRIGALRGRPEDGRVEELHELLRDEDEAAHTLRTIGRRSRPSDIVGLVRGHLLRDRADGAPPRRVLSAAVDVCSEAAVDRELAAAYARLEEEAAAAAGSGAAGSDRASPGGAPGEAAGRRLRIREHGLGGLRAPLVPPTVHTVPLRTAVSAWIPGRDARASRAWLEGLQRAGHPFRLLFPERYAPAAWEARRLFRRGVVGTPIQALLQVQVHPARLVDPARRLLGGGWLEEPLLNRLAAAVWLLGPAVGVRVLESERAGAFSVVCVVRHRAEARLSILEASVAPGVTTGGAPGLRDRLECTGRDGFLRVGGILEKGCPHARLSVHRGALEHRKRDLGRGPAAFREALARDRGWARAPRVAEYRLARETLDACQRAVRALTLTASQPLAPPATPAVGASGRPPPRLRGRSGIAQPFSEA